MVVRSIKALREAVENDMRKAMKEAERKSLDAMREAIVDFYDYAQPIVYERTYRLLNTPRVEMIETNGFKAYLDDDYTYPSVTHTINGVSYHSKEPTMADILELTNYDNRNSSVGYLHPTVGKKGYWEEAEKKMVKIVDKAIMKHIG